MKGQMSNKKQNLEALRHTAEHVLMIAMVNLYSEDKVIMAMGPATETGFYFDFDSPNDFKLSEDKLPEIEKEMKRVVKQDLLMMQMELSAEKAKKVFAKNKYKLEWLQGIAKRGEKASIYLTGSKEQLEMDKALLLGNQADLDPKKLKSFIDLCSGPHVESTGEIKAVKLLSVAGAYWHGDEKNKMLTRVYGTAFNSQKELDKYLWQLEESKKRDHRKLGQELELFMFDDEVGQGLPLWLPKGAFIRHKVMEYAFNTYLDKGYLPVVTPHMASSKLWQHSGHLDFYGESMYGGFGIEEEEYRLKPMNCPMHVKMYKSRPRSYREFPLRWTEMGTVYRYEKSGTLHGLTRVRGFTQDDAHIICSEEQLLDELVAAIKLTIEILTTFGFKDFEMNLSVRDPKNKNKFIGSDKAWEKAEKTLINALEKTGFKDYVKDIGGAVFYGPKIDLKLADSLGRMWQLSTIQVDFNLPGRFKMSYIDKDGVEKEPFMIHRALLGSLERFMGVYIEHTAGSFPVWLAPTQVKILPITDRHLDYAEKVKEELENLKIRVEIDDRGERLPAKIRDAEMEKVPYSLIVGDQEEKANQVGVRVRKEGDIGKMDLKEFGARVVEEVEGRM
jgi:threonyl-tRNA synthetase